MIVFSKLNTIKIETWWLLRFNLCSQGIIAGIKMFNTRSFADIRDKRYVCGSRYHTNQKAPPFQEGASNAQPSLELFKFWGINKNN